MRILVTGATGFIGQELVKHLLEEGYSLIVAVRKQQALPPHPRVTYVYIQEVSSSTDWFAAFEDCSVVIHAAAHAHILNETNQDSTVFRKINVDGTLHLAQQAITFGIKRFIYISSIGVYGSATNDTLLTELDNVAPRTNYALSKLEAEIGLKALAKESNLEVVIIRPPLVYGANAPGNFRRLLNFIDQELPIPLPLALVKNKRSMISRKNLVHFIRLCLEHPNAGNETFLIADTEALSTPDLIKILAKAMNKKVYLFPCRMILLTLGAMLLNKKPMHQQLCGSLQIDISKAHNLLGWQATIQAREALEDAARNYLSQI